MIMNKGIKEWRSKEEAVHGRECLWIWAGSNRRVTMMRRDIWVKYSTDGLWVCPRVCEPTGKGVDRHLR